MTVLVALAGLLALRLNMHFRGPFFDGFIGAALYTLFIIAGDVIGLLVGALVAWIKARFAVVRREGTDAARRPG